MIVGWTFLCEVPLVLFDVTLIELLPVEFRNPNTAPEPGSAFVSCVPPPVAEPEFGPLTSFCDVVTVMACEAFADVMPVGS